MALRIGNDNISKIYIGDIEASKIYMGEVQVYPSSSTSSTWTLTRKTNGEVMAEFEFSPDELPENISYNGTTYYQITQLSSDGNSYIVSELNSSGAVTGEVDVATNSSYSPIDYNFSAMWTFTLPSPYHIEINCGPM